MIEIIKNGRVIDPKNKFDGIKDLWIKDGVIISEEEGTLCAPSAEKEEINVVDATGKWVMPGFIDLHVHLREPGFTYKEDIQSGSEAAFAGGFTTICAMPNTSPTTDCQEIVRDIVEKAQEVGLVHILPVGAITLGQAGETLCDYESMVEAGICAISEDGKTVMDYSLMMEAMEKAKKLGLLVMDHTEDHHISGGVMNEGLVSYGLKLPGIPKEAEEKIVARDIELAEKTGCKLHLQHISTKGSIELIRQAKERGLDITAETAPHYFALTEWDIVNQQIIGEKPLAKTNMKMNPPLRTKEDVQAVKAALKDGTLDVIATDHAPHSEGDKALPFEKAPFGIIGLETSFPVSYTELVKSGVLTPMELVEKMSTKPAEILGLNRGGLGMGDVADVTMADVSCSYVIDSKTFRSKGRNTPFEGMTLWGKVYPHKKERKGEKI
ncbi:MAG: dihydroorotase [Anaerovorax sp.]